MLVTAPLAGRRPKREMAGAYTPYQSPEEAALTTSGRGSRVPLLIAAGIALLVVIGTLVAVALAVSGSRNTGGGSPIAPAAASQTPQTGAAQLLDLSATAMKKVSTLHYQSQASFYGVDSGSSGVSGSTPVSVTLDGDVALPDRYTMNTDAAPLGQFVVIGESTWNRSNGSRQWVRRATDDVGLGPVNPLSVANYMEYYKEGTPQDISSETKDGVLVRRVRFDVDTGQMAANSKQSSVRSLLLRSRITADAWIRITDNLLDSISLAVDSTDGTGVILRSAFSNYNGATAEIKIAPPDASQP